jgi:hypothetical protein
MEKWEVGQWAENQVKEHLREQGFSVKKLKMGKPFDLLINGKIRLEVKSCSRPHLYKTTTNKSWTAFWGSCPKGSKSKFDILALVRPQEEPFILFYSFKQIRRYMKNKSGFSITFSKRNKRIANGRADIKDLIIRLTPIDIRAD